MLLPLRHLGCQATEVYLALRQCVFLFSEMPKMENTFWDLQFKLDEGFNTRDGRGDRPKFSADTLRRG
jgi:hypothetical protein